MTPLKTVIEDCLTETLAELADHVDKWGRQVHPELLRKKAGMIDGIRFTEALLTDERMMDAKGRDQLIAAFGRDQLIAALRVLGVAQTTAAFATLDGFHDGVACVRTGVAKLIENIPVSA